MNKKGMFTAAELQQMRNDWRTFDRAAAKRDVDEARLAVDGREPSAERFAGKFTSVHAAVHVLRNCPGGGHLVTAAASRHGGTAYGLCWHYIDDLDGELSEWLETQPWNESSPGAGDGVTWERN